MAEELQQRKVLIFGDDPSIRNLLRIFTGELERQGGKSQYQAAAGAMINRETFDAVLVDLRCSKPDGNGGLRRIGEIQPSLVGRVLVIAAEVRDMETLKLLERYLANGLPRSLHWLLAEP